MTPANAGMNPYLDATIHISLTKNQKGPTAPHRANTVLSSSATGVSEDEETPIKHGVVAGKLFVPLPRPLPAIRWTQALEKTAL